MAKPLLDSLQILADKIDPEGTTEILPYSKDPTRSMENALERISENFTSGDKLPTVTSEDAGKVLSVDENGEWAATEIPAWEGGNY